MKLNLEVRPLGIGLCAGASVFLAILKWLEVIHWPLVWILAPIWIPFCFDFLLSLAAVIIYLCFYRK